MKQRPVLFRVSACFALLACVLIGRVRAQEWQVPHEANPQDLSVGLEHQPQAGMALPGASRWRLETVDSPGVGNYSSLELDASGWPHISYYDHNNGDLKYAHRDALGWDIETVDSTGNVGGYTSLELDAAGRPHISYCLLQPTSNWLCDNLKYAWHDGSIWHRESLATTGDVGGYTSLALVSGQPHISYYDFTNGDLKYFYRDSVSHWETVDGAGTDVGQYTSLAVDAGQRFISYLDSTNTHLKYAYYDGSWHTQTLDSTGTGGYYTSLDLCRTYSPGTPRITYYGDGDLKYAHKWIYDGWSYVSLDSDWVGPTSLVLDPLCRVHVSYFEQHNGDLRYTYDESGWHTETVDNDGDVWPYWTSLALDSKGWPHISYFDDSKNALGYAIKVPAAYLPLVLHD